MKEINPRHLEFVQNIQEAQSCINLVSPEEMTVFEWLVADVVGNNSGRAPLWFNLDEDGGFVEYSDSNGSVQRTRLGRYITRNSKLSRGDYEYAIQQVVAKLAGILDYCEDDFTLLSGDDLVATYRDNIDGGNGCMRNHMAFLTEFYAINPDKVQMLVYKGKARALLWETDEGTKVLDRIYPNDGQHLTAFNVYAAKHEALVRGHNGVPEGETLVGGRMDLEVTVTVHESKMWPYMDTFRYVKGENPRDGSTVVLSMDMGCQHSWILNSTTGGPWNNARECSGCGNYGRCDDNGYCETCLENAWECDHCGNTRLGDEEYTVHSGEAEEAWCGVCTHEEALSCSECGARADCDDVPSDWYTYLDETFACADCGAGRMCAMCGVPAPHSSYGLGINAGGLRNRVTACSTGCRTQIFDRLCGAVDNLTAQEEPNNA